MLPPRAGAAAAITPFLIGYRVMIIGTAGHIDHGKTALVKALTGIDCDRLKEEKARGITIDLGFAYLPIAHGQVLGFVDVPGHERFVHTMLAGASGIDFALLTVAANDGVKPQTLEHLAILDLLGIERGVVIVTKADLATPERLAAVISQIRAATAGTVLEDADILPVSAVTGQGVDELRAYLADAATDTPDRSAEARFRLAVDRVFTLAGVGVVVTGTVLSGLVHVGDHVQVSPSGLMARVRSLHAQNRPEQIGRAGDRCALNLSGPDISKDAIRRGDVVLEADMHAPTDRIDAVLRVLPGEQKSIGQWFPVRLHHAAAEVGAHIVLLDDKAVQPSASAKVQLVLDRPIAAAVPDRFVVRDVSAQRTLGGGRFIDLRPPARRRRTPERRMQRAALAISDPLAAFAALLAAPPFASDLALFSRDRALAAAQTERIITELELVVLRSQESPGLPFRLPNGRFSRQASRQRLLPTTPKIRISRALVENGCGLCCSHGCRSRFSPSLCRGFREKGEIVLDGAFVRLSTHEVRLGPEDQAAWDFIAPLLGGAERFRPPRVRDIAATTGRPEREVRRLLKLAGRMGWADEVAHDHFFLRLTTDEMVRIAANVAAHTERGEFTAAQFRDRLENGRKVVDSDPRFL